MYFDMSLSERVRQLLHPEEADRDRATQRTQNILNPFLRRDGSLANPYLNYQAIADSPMTSDRVKGMIAQATGITPSTAVNTAANTSSGSGSAVSTVRQGSTAQQNTPGRSATQQSTTGGNALVDTAKKYLGTKYVFGGTTPDGFDCSGLVQYAYAQNGISIPRTSQEQFRSGAAVSSADLRPGDLVFFKGSDGTQTAPGHVGMYVGNGQYIQAPKTGDVVKISDLSARGDYVGARRYS